MPIERKGKFIRERIREPSLFVRGSFRTKKVKGGHEVILGHLKAGNALALQAIRHPLSEGVASVKRHHKARR